PRSWSRRQPLIALAFAFSRRYIPADSCVEKSLKFPTAASGAISVRGWAMALSVQRATLMAGLMALVFARMPATCRAALPPRPVPVTLPAGDPDPAAPKPRAEPVSAPGPTITSATVEEGPDPHGQHPRHTDSDTREPAAL